MIFRKFPNPHQRLNDKTGGLRRSPVVGFNHLGSAGLNSFEAFRTGSYLVDSAHVIGNESPPGNAPALITTPVTN